MISCEAMSERMPRVAGGRDSWSPEEVAHLQACAECSNEWRIVQATARLGEAAVAKLNPDPLGGLVVARLKTARRADRVRRTGWMVGLAAAAAVTFVVWTGAGHQPQGTTQSPSSLLIPVAELDSLSTSQLEAVLDGFDAPLDEEPSPSTPMLNDLNDQQLERVLRSLEG
jgi:anti-sigma factor RsiW